MVIGEINWLGLTVEMFFLIVPILVFAVEVRDGFLNIVFSLVKDANVFGCLSAVPVDGLTVESCLILTGIVLITLEVVGLGLIVAGRVLEAFVPL